MTNQEQTDETGKPLTYWGGKEQTPEQYNPEGDKRYLDLLDEEAKKECGMPYKEVSDNSENAESYYPELAKTTIERDCLRRYFIEKLQEKDLLYQSESKGNWGELMYQQELNQKLLSDKLELMATIAEKEKSLETEIRINEQLREDCLNVQSELSEAKATIEKLNKELERYKNPLKS